MGAILCTALDRIPIELQTLELELESSETKVYDAFSQFDPPIPIMTHLPNSLPVASDPRNKTGGLWGVGDTAGG